jgi:hypothetical protein
MFEAALLALGLFVGYQVRLREWLREKRLEIYDEMLRTAAEVERLFDRVRDSRSAPMHLELAAALETWGSAFERTWLIATPKMFVALRDLATALSNLRPLIEDGVDDEEWREATDAVVWARSVALAQAMTDLGIGRRQVNARVNAEVKRRSPHKAGRTWGGWLRRRSR